MFKNEYYCLRMKINYFVSRNYNELDSWTCVELIIVHMFAHNYYLPHYGLNNTTCLLLLYNNKTYMDQLKVLYKATRK